MARVVNPDPVQRTNRSDDVNVSNAVKPPFAVRRGAAQHLEGKRRDPGGLPAAAGACRRAARRTRQRRSRRLRRGRAQADLRRAPGSRGSTAAAPVERVASFRTFFTSVSRSRYSTATVPASAERTCSPNVGESGAAVSTLSITSGRGCRRRQVGPRGHLDEVQRRGRRIGDTPRRGSPRARQGRGNAPVGPWERTSDSGVTRAKGPRAEQPPSTRASDCEESQGGKRPRLDHVFLENLYYRNARGVYREPSCHAPPALRGEEAVRGRGAAGAPELPAPGHRRQPRERPREVASRADAPDLLFRFRRERLHPGGHAPGAGPDLPPRRGPGREGPAAVHPRVGEAMAADAARPAGARARRHAGPRARAGRSSRTGGRCSWRTRSGGSATWWCTRRSRCFGSTTRSTWR